MHFIQGRIKVVVGDAELLRLRGIVCDALKNRSFLHVDIRYMGVVAIITLGLNDTH